MSKPARRLIPPRIYIGMAFAMIEATAMLATLLPKGGMPLQVRLR